MKTYGPCFVTHDSFGNKYVSVFGGGTMPASSWMESPTGAVMQEFNGDTGQGRGTTAPEGLYPPKQLKPSP